MAGFIPTYEMSNVETPPVSTLKDVVARPTCHDERKWEERWSIARIRQLDKQILETLFLRNPRWTLKPKAKASAELSLRGSWGRVEAVAHALLKFGLVSGELVRHYVKHAPVAARMCSVDELYGLRKDAEGDALVESSLRELALIEGVRVPRPAPAKVSKPWQQTRRPRRTSYTGVHGGRPDGPYAG